MKDVLRQLKENRNTDSKAKQLWNLINSTSELEFAEDLSENIVSLSYVVCEIHNATEKGGDLTPLGMLIGGITNWSAHWFYVDGSGNILDLTNDKIDMIIDDIIDHL